MGKPQPQKTWQSRAIDYAFENGWRVLPIHPGKLSKEEKEGASEICAQLGHSLFNGHTAGTADVAQIKKWTGMPGALIGARTGVKSNLMALEVPIGEDSPLTQSNQKQLEEKLPDTRVVQEFRKRRYFLFRCPEAPGFDGLRRSDGLILHGEDSIVPLPGPPWRRRRRFTWLLKSEKPGEGDNLPTLPNWVKALFGASKNLDSALSGAGEREKKGNELQGGNHLPTQRDSSPPTRRRTDTSLPFQSGDDLRISASAKESLPFSWLENGALSVLTGPPKTSGKSTFAANLAAHVASGRWFLGKELTGRPVVFLSDLPPTRLRTIISDIGLDREARSRLQVLHPKDVAHADWRSLLGSVFDHAAQEEAALIIIDSLDQFVQAKGGLDPTTSDEVNFMLTAKLPTECATLAVKASPIGTAEPMSETIERLGLLGTNADLVARLDAPPANSSYPTLRRLQFRGRLGDTPSHILCEMIRDRYQMLKTGSVRGARSFERVTMNGTQSPARGDGRMEKGHENIQLEASERQAKLGFPSGNSTNGFAE